ncbi:hypothetical protein NL676_031306 [Syzygium grande]|nr:hypothetical protein NL676_031306 [Syzygium grande]
MCLGPGSLQLRADHDTPTGREAAHTIATLSPDRGGSVKPHTEVLATPGGHASIGRSALPRRTSPPPTRPPPPQ